MTKQDIKNILPHLSEARIKKLQAFIELHASERTAPLLEVLIDIISKIEALSLQYKFNSNIIKAKAAISKHNNHE